MFRMHETSFQEKGYAKRQPTTEKPEKCWILLMHKSSGFFATYVFVFHTIPVINRTKPMAAKIEPTPSRLPAMLTVPL